MTADQVRARVDNLAREVASATYATDEERWHQLEDVIKDDALRAIANGTADDPAAVAATALLTARIDFTRWYA